MNFENSFTVPVAPADVWEAMMDFERVAPCMPGAEITERTGENAYKVQVRVKVGPMSMTYRGQAEITDRDDEARTAAMRVQARETRGQGSANAIVQIRVGEEGAGTRATMATELKLSGRAAAMGRGVITDVSQALVSEFADNLAQMLSGAQGDGAGGPVEASAAGADAARARTTPSAPSPGPVAAPGSGAGGAAGEIAPSAPPRPEAPPPSQAPPSSSQAPPSLPQAPPAPPQVPPSPPQAAASRPESAPPAPEKDSLDAAQLLRSVVASRLREPRTQLSVGAAVALACLVLGFSLGRRAGRR
jgi:carbon monoxide dehydrogenase subunit G